MATGGRGTRAGGRRMTVAQKETPAFAGPAQTDAAFSDLHDPTGNVTARVNESLLDAALKLSAEGIPVFPCKHDKTPLTPHGFKDASTDAETVHYWWTEWPHALIGMPTGEASGIFALDVDVRDSDGNETLSALGPLPLTLAYQTPSGGAHHLFRFPRGAKLGNTAGKLGPSLDTRGGGGYVIRHDLHGCPVLADEPLADVPQWLLDKLTEKPRSRPNGHDPVAGEAIPEGGRNSTLASLGGTMRRRGMTQASIQAALLAENAARCNPPLDDNEVRTIAASVGRYPAAHEDDTSHEDAPAIERVSFADVLNNPPTPPRFIIPDWLPADTLTLLAAHGGAGKSWVALFIAVSVALGAPLLGCTPTRARTAFYSGEDSADVLRWRLYRICSALGLNAEAMRELADWLHIYDATGSVPILLVTTPEGPTTTSRYDELRELTEANGIELLILDNASDTFAGNENARSEVRAFVNKLVALVRARHGAVLLLAHVNKVAAKYADDSTAWSGSTAWHNSARSRWYLRPPTEDETDSVLLLEKSNHGCAGLAAPVRWDATAGLWRVGDVYQRGATTDVAANLDAVLTCAARLIAAGQRISPSRGAKNSLFPLARTLPDWPPGVDSRMAAALVQRAMAAGFLRVAESRATNRHTVEALEMTDAGLARAAQFRVAREVEACAHV